MLDVIREGVKKPWIKIIVFIIIISFVFAGYFTSSFFLGDPNAIAIVNGQSISYKDFQDNYNSAKARYGDSFDKIFSTPEQVRSFQEQVLQNIISRQVVLQYAEKEGVRVSVEQLREAIQSMPALQADGHYSPALLEQILLTRGWSREQFKQLFASDMVFSQLLDGLTKSSMLLESELAENYRFTGQKRSGKSLQIPLSLFKDEVEVSEEEAKAYYERSLESYRKPEQVKVSWLELNLSNLQASIEVSDSEIENYYKTNEARYLAPAKKRYAHILKASESGDAEAKAAAEAIKARLEKGEDFAKLAEKESDDEFSGENGGDLGFDSLADLGEEFAKAGESLKKVGDIVGPIKSDFGYHIIKLTEIQEGKRIPLAEVKQNIEAEIKKQKAEERYYQKLDLLKEKAFEFGDSLKESAEAVGVDVQTSEMFARNTAKGVLANQEVLDAIFSDQVLTDRLNSDVIEIGDNHAVVVRVEAHEDSRIQEFAEVKDKVFSRLKLDKQKAAAIKFAKSVEEAVTHGNDPKSLLESKNLQWQDLNEVDRTSAGLSYPQLQRFFKLAKPVEGKVSTDIVESPNAVALLLVNKVIDGDLNTADKALKEQLKQRQQRLVSNLEFETFIASLRQQASVKRHLERLQQN